MRDIDIQAAVAGALARREEARRDWLSSGLLFLALIPAEDDPPEKSREYRNEISAVSRALDEDELRGGKDELGRYGYGSVTVGPGSTIIGSWSDPVTMFTLALAPVVVPAITKILVTWLKTRSGRKVRGQIGDIQIEAQTAEEVARLLQYALELRQKAKSKKKEEP
jgi:hypothetical protein